MKKILITAIIAISAHSFAYALSHNAKVGMTGVESNGQIYVNTATNPNKCLNGGIYFQNLETTKQVLAVALSAKSNNREVRVDYTKNAQNICLGYAIYEI